MCSTYREEENICKVSIGGHGAVGSEAVCVSEAAWVAVTVAAGVRAFHRKGSGRSRVLRLLLHVGSVASLAVFPLDEEVSLVV